MNDPYSCLYLYLSVCVCLRMRYWWSTHFLAALAPSFQGDGAIHPAMRQAFGQMTLRMGSTQPAARS